MTTPPLPPSTALYRRIMTEQGLTPADIQDTADLTKLPILTKEAVREHFDDLRSRSTKVGKVREVYTSGSTGAPLRLLASGRGIAFKWAVWWRHREWHGVRRGDLHVNLMTKPLVSPLQDGPPYWRWNRLESQAIVPMQQITPAKTSAIVEFLTRTPVIFYSGYPSILHSLAVHAASLGISINRGPRVIFTGAEAVHDQQRVDLERLTGAEVAEMYGFNEGAGNASSCAEGNLHEDFEFGHLECIDPVTDDATGRASGPILATGFSTGAFPLIRYDVGDVATWMPADYMCPCGRESRVVPSIDGRWEDYILTPDGHKARRLGEIFREMPSLKQFQMIQDNRERVTLRLVTRESYTADDEDRLRRRIELWIGSSLAVDFDYVDEIEPAPNGKFQRIVSSIAGN